MKVNCLLAHLDV
ncbi:BnaC05g32740D [Brassica napus]|uniref:BnaC05g32740D protein n=1 Tax=Brassica napus TaxID=3708 RepID=A0A078GDK3_BRANA|nr:BnaC05g32740D [Brassica napus]